MLNNTKKYAKLQEDATTTKMKLVNDAIERFKKQKLIDGKVAEGLSRNCHTTNISKYVQISSYVKGIQDFLKKLEKKKDIPEESIPVTLDIKSLYTDIRNNTRVKVVRKPCE